MPYVNVNIRFMIVVSSILPGVTYLVTGRFSFGSVVDRDRSLQLRPFVSLCSYPVMLEIRVSELKFITLGPDGSRTRILSDDWQLVT